MPNMVRKINLIRYHAMAESVCEGFFTKSAPYDFIADAANKRREMDDSGNFRRSWIQIESGRMYRGKFYCFEREIRSMHTLTEAV